MDVLQWFRPRLAPDAEFRRVPEGWLFRGPGQSPLGRRLTYLLDDVQKTRVIEAFAPKRVLGGSLAAIGILVALAVGVATGTQGSVAATVAVATLWLAAVLLAANLDTFRTLRPILATARLSGERITFIDQLRAQIEVWPLPGLVIAAASMVLLFLLKARAVLVAPGWTPEATLDLAVMMVFGAVALIDLVIIAIKLSVRR
jgi:hypothetical protein